MNLEGNVLLTDGEVFKTKDSDIFEEIIKYREEKDRLLNAEISKLKVVFPEEGETAEEFKARTRAALPIDEIKDHIITSNGLFLEMEIAIGDQVKHGVLPLRTIALASLMERAKLSGFTMTNMNNGPDYLAMDKKTKFDFVNKALQLYKGFAKILFRDRKVTSVMSGQYYQIIYRDLDNGLKALKKDFPDLKFAEGVISHEIFNETYKLNANELEEDFLLALQDAGIPATTVEMYVDAYTGDFGNVAAKFASRIVVDGKSLTFGKPESIKHSGKKTSNEIIERAKKMYSVFKQNEDALRVLPGVKIKHPAGCLRTIAKEYHLPKKIAMAVAEELDLKKKCSAWEIYWCLNDIIDKAEAAGLSFTRVMQLKEAVAETLTKDYRKFDKDFLWARSSASDVDSDEE